MNLIKSISAAKSVSGQKTSVSQTQYGSAERGAPACSRPTELTPIGLGTGEAFGKRSQAMRLCKTWLWGPFGRKVGWCFHALLLRARLKLFVIPSYRWVALSAGVSHALRAAWR